jgi:hypothetical protein
MNLGSVFKELATAIKNDEEQAVLPLIATTATSIANNPTLANAAAAGSQLLFGVIAAQPNIEQEVLQGLASEVNTLVQGALTSIPKGPTTPVQPAAPTIAPAPNKSV